MPRLARVLKKASLFCGCSVCENAQNSLTKFTWGDKMVRMVPNITECVSEQSLNIMINKQTEQLVKL